MATNDLVMSPDQITAALKDAPADSAPEAAEPDELSTDGGEESSWEDKEPGDEEETDEVDAAAEDDGKSARKKSAQIRQVKANGKVHEVNMADQAAVDQLLSLGLGARQVFSQVDKLKKADATKTQEITELSKFKDLWNKLEAAKTDHDALYEKVFGRPFKDAATERARREAAYENASPEQRASMDLQREIENERRQLKAERDSIESSKAEQAKVREEADLRALNATLTPEFQKFEFTEKVKNADTAAKMNKALWKLAIAELKELGDLDELPPAAVRKAFRETHDMLWGAHEAAATKTVKDSVEKQKKTAKEQAQQASTRNYGSGRSQQDLAKLAKDPTKLWKKMFG